MTPPLLESSLASQTPQKPLRGPRGTKPQARLDCYDMSFGPHFQSMVLLGRPLGAVGTFGPAAGGLDRVI